MDKTGEEIVERIFQSAAQLFEDPLSETARRRQEQVLLSSLILILISFSLVEAQSLTILGLKLGLLQTSILLIAIGSVVAYFLI